MTSGVKRASNLALAGNVCIAASMLALSEQVGDLLLQAFMAVLWVGLGFLVRASLRRRDGSGYWVFFAGWMPVLAIASGLMVFAEVNWGFPMTESVIIDTLLWCGVGCHVLAAVVLARKANRPFVGQQGPTAG